jgi:hypothetical protein
MGKEENPVLKIFLFLYMMYIKKVKEISKKKW